jgi:YVTN family beta-propeller protein
MNGIAVSPLDGSVYVANAQANAIFIFDGITGELAGDIPTGYTPFGVALNLAKNEIYVTDLGSNWLSALDGATRTLQSTVAVPEFPMGIQVILLTLLVSTLQLARSARKRNTGHKKSISRL